MKRILPLLLALVLLLALSACGQQAAPSPTPTQAASTPEPTAAATPEPSVAPVTDSDLEPETPPATDSDLEPQELPASSSNLYVPGVVDMELPINVMVLNGPTGFGMAQLIRESAEGSALLNYNISVESDASNVSAALVSGSVDLAVLPTNAAAALWNKTQGGVRVAAEVVRGNLYLLQNTEKEAITSFEDLKGKTVYAPAQNPTFITTLLCKAMGLEPGTDVTIDNSYAQPADLRTALAAGEVDLAVLPEPMVTIAKSANDKLGIALDLREAWKEANGSDSLVMGCVVVRTAFAQEHPNELAAFLTEYKASVDYVSDAANAEAAGAMIAEAGVFAQAKVAEKALPRCSLCFVTGEEMRGEIGAFLEQLFALNPASVGGNLPDESFYYLP